MKAPILKISSLFLLASLAFAFSHRFNHQEITFNISERVSNDSFEIVFDSLFPQTNIIYEDSAYSVVSSCAGEWGGTVKFRSKKTKKYHSCQAMCTRSLHLLNNVYYVTVASSHLHRHSSILRIEDPLAMEKFKLPRPEGKLGKIKVYSIEDTESKSTIGSERICEVWDYYFLSSFIMRNQLYQISTDNQNTYITTMLGQEIQIIDTLSKTELHNTYRTPFISEKGTQIIPFKENTQRGYIEIKDSTIIINKFIK